MTDFKNIPYMEVCGICGEIFKSNSIMRSRCLCDKCIKAYATPENLKSFYSDGINREDFSLNQYYGFVFQDASEIEKALDFYIDAKMTREQLTKCAVECAKNDEIWFKWKIEEMEGESHDRR
jgi:hypothetical protein